MPLRRLVLPVGLAAAVGGPYAYFSGADISASLPDLWQWEPTAETMLEEPLDEQPAMQDISPAAAGAGLALADPRVPLEETLRFDVSPDWIMRRWPRVSTHLSDLQLQGFRVPLVSGTGITDLAGSLTYFADRQQQIQRIEFHGTTGDASRLIYWLQAQHGFRRDASANPGTWRYVVTWNGNVHSQLEVRPAGVMRSDTPHGRFNVTLVMRRPRSLF